MAALGPAALVGRGTVRAASRWPRSSQHRLVCGCRTGRCLLTGIIPPFLWQHLTKRYTGHLRRLGRNQVREAQGDEGERRHQGCAPTAAGRRPGRTIGSLVAFAGRPTASNAPDAGRHPAVRRDRLEREHRPRRRAPSNCRAAGHRHRQTQDHRRRLASGWRLKRRPPGFPLPSGRSSPRWTPSTEQLMKDYPMGIKADTVRSPMTGDGASFRPKRGGPGRRRRRACLRGAGG